MHPIVQMIANLFNRQARRKALAMSPMPESIPDDYTEIEREIAGMMTESTGAHICDSGGAGGRHWQHNRLVADFRLIPVMTIDSWEGGLPIEKTLDDVCIDKNLFHFLTEHLSVSELSKELDGKLKEYIGTGENYGLNGVEAFFEENPHYFDTEEDYIVGSSFRMDNSYNYSSPLSQVIQYGFFRYKDEEFMVLQIHNGADVRGGYTDPRIFSVDGELESLYCLIYGMDFYCTECYMDWQRDSNGYTYPKGSEIKIVEETTGRIFKKKTGKRIIIHTESDCGGEIVVS